MATMAKDRFDSNIYENTDFMPKSATNAPETNEVSTIYEPLRMKDGKLNQVNAATTMKGKCVKRRWWIAGAVVTVLLCTGLSLLTGWVAGTPQSSNKPNGIKDITDKQEITQLPDTLQDQFAEMQRAMEEKFNNEKTKLEDKITNMEDRLQAIQMGQSATEAKCNKIDEVNIEDRLTEIEKNTADNQEITQVTNKLQEEVENLQSSQRSIDEKIIKLNIKTTKLEGIQNATEDKIETRLQSVQNKKTAAFSVHPSAGQLELANGAVVPFNQIILDSMDGFDTIYHHYVCPTTGTYYFSLCLNLGKLGGKYDGNSELHLYVSGSSIMEVYSHNNDDVDDDDHYHRDQGCNAVIYKCSAGSTVLVKCNLSAGCRIYGERRSILSGFLIYPE